MSEGVRLVIPGPPVAKERARRGRGGHWYTPVATSSYEEAVAWACRAQRTRFGEQPVRVEITFERDRALVLVEPTDTENVGPGDLDNLAKSILDGLQKGELYANDKQVVELHLRFDPAPSA